MGKNSSGVLERLLLLFLMEPLSYGLLGLLKIDVTINTYIYALILGYILLATASQKSICFYGLLFSLFMYSVIYYFFQLTEGVNIS